jgi:plastocyanin
MRHRRTFVLGAVVALLLLGFAGTAQADSGSGKNRAEVVRMQDRCDPATFNAALGEGACVGNGDTTFPDFFAEFQAKGSVGHWRFHPDDLTIRAGQSVKAVNEGGELHTFTLYPGFGPGCAPPLNQPGEAVSDKCPADPTALPPDAVFPGDSLSTGPLARGTYDFQCLIHPWMRTVVTVR